MNQKRNLLIACISVLVLLLFSLTIKWPVPIDLRYSHYPRSKAHEPIVSSPGPSSLSAQKPKMIAFPNEGIPILMYHSISTLPGNSLGVPVKQFNEEIAWLRRQGYHSISIEDLYQALVNKASVPEKPILLTFDDGYGDNYRSAWPIMQHNNFRATFFIITNSVGHGMMNWEQLNDLIKQGNFIGSHTVHHLDLASLTENQQDSELNISKQELEQHLGISVQALCFPSGKYNKTTLKLMSKLGYRLGFTTKPGRVHLGDVLLTLKRERIYGGMPLVSFQRLFP